jgi:hypothetical protein
MKKIIIEDKELDLDSLDSSKIVELANKSIEKAKTVNRYSIPLGKGYIDGRECEWYLEGPTGRIFYQIDGFGGCVKVFEGWQEKWWQLESKIDRLLKKGGYGI